MTNIEHIRQFDSKKLAELLIEYDESYNCYRTPDEKAFDTERYDDCVSHVIEWLNSKSEDEG